MSSSRTGSEATARLTALAVSLFLIGFGMHTYAGVDMDVWADRSDIYRGRMNLLQKNGLVGLALVFVGLLAGAGTGGAAIAQAVVEMFDTVLRMGSNVVSFARLAAFGLTHAVISEVVWDGTTALWDRGGAGVALAVALFVIGTAAAVAFLGAEGELDPHAATQMMLLAGVSYQASRFGTSIVASGGITSPTSGSTVVDTSKTVGLLQTPAGELLLSTAR